MDVHEVHTSSRGVWRNAAAFALRLPQVGPDFVARHARRCGHRRHATGRHAAPLHDGGPMTTDRVGKGLRRNRGRRGPENVSDVHGADVNTVHAGALVQNVHTVPTAGADACDNPGQMPPDTATRLRQLRAARRLSQEDVAAAVEVDRSMISKMEKGVPGGRDLVKKLAEFYDVSVDWLLSEEGDASATRTSLLTDVEASVVENLRALPEDVAEAFRKSIEAAARKR
jgi:transcriptional regulator with XRE-family HTH domain